MNHRTILLDVDDGVATITLNRPEKRNAIGDGMARELDLAYVACDRDDDVRVVVLTGAGTAFCSGADLAAGDETFAGTNEAFSAAGIATPAWSVRKPVIAALNGPAVGLGLTLALQCDIRLFAADAIYGVVQVRRGVMGDAYSHWVLPRMIGLARAAEVLLTGATFDGRRAVELGIGSRALPAGEVLPAALAMAREIATHTAPLSVAASKALLWDSFNLSAAEVGERETDAHRVLMAHDDAREGVRAYLERRPPSWTGRLPDRPWAPTYVAVAPEFEPWRNS
jgi:enoyl-CoA hydratase/carnithine racemase